jgi:hypothetical protein
MNAWLKRSTLLLAIVGIFAGSVLAAPLQGGLQTGR